MFGRNSDFIPRTYSVRGYKKRDSFTFRKAFKYFAYLVIILTVGGLTALSVARLI